MNTPTYNISSAISFMWTHVTDARWDIVAKMTKGMEAYCYAKEVKKELNLLLNGVPIPKSFLEGLMNDD